MSVDATAEALAGGEAMPAPVEIEAPTEEQMDAELDAVFDKLQDDEPDTSDTSDSPEAEELEEAKEEATEEAEPVEEPAPTDLPAGVRDAWKDMPEAARKAVQESHREMAAKTRDMGRMVKGLEPIQDVLVQAARDLPAMANKTPEVVAAEIFELAKYAQKLDENPRAALEEIAKARGVDLGQPAQEGERGLLDKVAKLERDLAEAKAAADPARITQEVTASLEQERQVQAVNEFASSKADWSEVEDKVPAAVQYVMATNEGLSHRDILEQAYLLAGGQHSAQPKAKEDPAPSQAPESPAPDKAKAAKSVNVSSQPTRKRVLTEDEMLDAVYDRAMKD